MIACQKCKREMQRAIVRCVPMRVCEHGNTLYLAGIWSWIPVWFPGFELMTFYPEGHYLPALLQHITDNGGE